MECVTVSTELLYPQKKRQERFRSDYNVDFCREVKKRWLVGGVLVAVAAAVVAPKAGAAGGNYMHANFLDHSRTYLHTLRHVITYIFMQFFSFACCLHTEYMRYLPLTYIYYRAGFTAASPLCPPARLMFLCVLHAHVVAPALCAVTVEAFRGSGLDHRIVKGAMISSVGAGSGWLSLGLCAGRGRGAGGLVTANYLSSLVATPLTMLIFCGRANIPPLGGIFSTIIISVTPYALGVYRQQNNNNNKTCNNTILTTNNNKTKCNTTEHNYVATKLSALLLVYVECCDNLTEAEGSLYVGDVLVTLLLVLVWLLCCGGACRAWRGSVGGGGGGALLAAALPKGYDTSWESGANCASFGLGMIARVLRAPLQALILAALVGGDSEGGTNDWD